MFLSDEKKQKKNNNKVAGYCCTAADWRTPLHTRTTLTHSIFFFIYKS